MKVLTPKYSLSSDKEHLSLVQRRFVGRGSGGAAGGEREEAAVDAVPLRRDDCASSANGEDSERNSWEADLAEQWLVAADEGWDLVVLDECSQSPQQRRRPSAERRRD